MNYHTGGDRAAWYAGVVQKQFKLEPLGLKKRKMKVGSGKGRSGSKEGKSLG